MAKPGSEPWVRLRILCEPLPPRECVGYTEIEIGIQQGENSHPPTRRTADRAEFEIAVRVRQDPKTGAPVFLGDGTHGKPQERFLYLTWHGWNGASRERFRRMKVPLASIPWETVATAVAGERFLEASVCGLARDGGPACATVPLRGAGWQLKEEPSEE